MGRERARIGIFGAGWVGLVTGACFAELGHAVVIRDVVPERIAALQRGELPFHEDELPELLERNRERMRFTLDPGEAVDGVDFAFVCVDTPPTYSGDADLSRVWTVVDELPRVERRFVLVMKSTVPVGTGEKVRAGLDARGLDHVGYVSNPEFLAEGRAIRDFMNPDRIVVGAFAEEDADAVAALYENIEGPIVRTDVNSAEMIKMAANAFLMTRISFINEIANVCEATGADVVRVAEGIGLDHRLGPHFLRAGIGWGGSCLDGRETVLARREGRARLQTLEALFEDLAHDEDSFAVFPDDLEVLAWRDGSDGPEFLPVSAATRRAYRGDLLEIRTKMGRRVRCTPDHPFVTTGPGGGYVDVKLADELATSDWLPVAMGAPSASVSDGVFDLSVVKGGPVSRADPAVGGAELDVMTVEVGGRRALRSGREPTIVPSQLPADAWFWRMVGLYLTEGHCSWNRTSRRLFWSFHATDEETLVAEVCDYWRSRGVRALILRAPTATHVVVSSRVLATWWLDELGLGANCYEQRLPDAVWDAPSSHRRSLLAGLWLGDGSWSYVNDGPNVVLEYGTVSRELADGVLRLLGEFGIVARLKVGRTAKSTVETYWLVVSGAEQVESLLDLLPERRRQEVAGAVRSIQRIAPTGYRRHSANAAWVRVVDITAHRFDGFVYSLEVPQARTFVTSGGLVVDNCFPKDSLALKQLASNSGYHFQLLSAVIEVNELQKRRVIGKLQKHLGKLNGKKVALLGLAFKAGTSDLREAPSLVLASRLLAEGAEVRAWDPVADARELIHGATFCGTFAEAVAGADAAVIVTEWPELRELPTPAVRESMRKALIIDGRNLLDPATVRKLGFVYEGVGRASSPADVLPETAEPEPAPSSG